MALTNLRELLLQYAAGKLEVYAKVPDAPAMIVAEIGAVQCVTKPAYVAVPYITFDNEEQVQDHIGAAIEAFAMRDFSVDKAFPSAKLADAVEKLRAMFPIQRLLVSETRAAEAARVTDIQIFKGKLSATDLLIGLGHPHDVGRIPTNMKLPGEGIVVHGPGVVAVRVEEWTLGT